MLRRGRRGIELLGREGVNRVEGEVDQVGDSELDRTRVRGIDRTVRVVEWPSLQSRRSGAEFRGEERREG